MGGISIFVYIKPWDLIINTTTYSAHKIYITI